MEDNVSWQTLWILEADFVQHDEIRLHTEFQVSRSNRRRYEGLSETAYNSATYRPIGVTHGL